MSEENAFIRENQVYGETRQPAPCQVCGHNTAADETGVSIISNTRARGRELLAFICLRCYARGILYAANASYVAPGSTG